VLHGVEHHVALAVASFGVTDRDDVARFFTPISTPITSARFAAA
jgi:hypothetical protein